MKAKKGSYETAVLKATAKLGVSSAYKIAKEILRNEETRRMIRKKYESSKDVLKIYSVVLKAIQRLVKKGFLIAVEDKEKQKRYGLSFKGLIYLEPNYYEIENVIEKNRESLFNYQNVQIKKEIIRKNEVYYKIDYADYELKFLLQILTKASKTDYDAVIAFICRNTDWKKDNGENIINCLYAIFKNFVWFESLLKIVVNALDDKTITRVFERFKENLINSCLIYLANTKTYLSNISKITNDADVKKQIEKDTKALEDAIMKLLLFC